MYEVEEPEEPEEPEDDGFKDDIPFGTGDAQTVAAAGAGLDIF
jgi:hypothetical protein